MCLSQVKASFTNKRAGNTTARAAKDVHALGRNADFHIASPLRRDRLGRESGRILTSTARPLAPPEHQLNPGESKGPRLTFNP